MKNFLFALALASFALAGCASEEAETDATVVEDEAMVETPPADDMMMEDSTMMEDGAMMEDSTMMEDGAMMEDTTAAM